MNFLFTKNGCSQTALLHFIFVRNETPETIRKSLGQGDKKIKRLKSANPGSQKRDCRAGSLPAFMKRNILLSVLMICCLYTFSQSTDSIVRQHTTDIQEIRRTTDGLKKSIDTLGQVVTKLDKKTSTTVAGCANCEIGFMQWILIFSPALVFMIVLLAIRKKLKDFNLKEALSETELRKKVIPNPEYTAEKIRSLAENPLAAGLLTTLLPATIEVTASDEPPKSSSRYIAFITSALTWVLALCITCFFIYQYIKSNQAPTLSGLSSVLLALGIGVVPYAFNKISKALE